MAGAPAAKRQRSLCDQALGFDDETMPMGAWGNPVLPPWTGPVPLDVPRAKPAPLPAASSTEPPTTLPKSMKTSSVRAPPSVHDARQRKNAIDAWLDIVGTMGNAFEARKKMPALEAEHLEPFFETKKPGTLAVHASSWRLFIRYAQAEGHDPSLLDEEMGYQYLQSLVRCKAPASRGTTFLKGMNFAFGQMGFVRGYTIAQSARCRGAAAVSFSTKRERRQRDPLTMEMLRALEVEINLAATGMGLLTKAEAVVAGFLVFCVHTRSRCADAARILHEPTLDDAEDNDPISSFIEAATIGSELKTGNTDAKSKVRFPVVGLSKGLTNLPWAETWLSLREEIGFSAADDECLMLEPLAEGEFGEGRVEAGQATEWLRHLLAKLGFEASSLLNTGSHSCKATLLSVCAKAGLPRDVRRTLGGHAIPGDRSVEEYSRDVLAEPLRQLGLLLEQVRQGKFSPDSSRSGRWQRGHAKIDTTKGLECVACQKAITDGTCFECPCGQHVHDREPCTYVCTTCGLTMCALCSSVGTHVCEISASESSDESSSCDDDSDGERVSMALEDENDVVQASDTKSAALAKGIENGSDVVFPEGGFFLNRFTEVAHNLKDIHTTACGIAAVETTFDYHYEAHALEGRKLCWRPGCSKWTRG